MDKTDALMVLILVGTVIAITLVLSFHDNGLAGLEAKCKGLCAGEGLILSSSDYPQCNCAPDKPYYRDDEIQTFYIQP